MSTACPSPLDVTVVMPSFNRSALVTQALDSVRNQTARPFEILVVDDASTDDTVQRVEAWRDQTGFPVRIERLAKNGGVASARNRAMQLATTRYIAFLDSDDEHLPETLAKLVGALEETPGAVVSFADATKVLPTKK
jgi:glycosyltransferase involved in cell wall biosynthesis